MVFLTRCLRFSSRYKDGVRYRPGFLDTMNLRVEGGHGGAGLPRYGGRGGNGGCVMAVATENLNLSHIQSKYKEHFVSAGNGQDSVKNKILGEPGEDVCLEIPVGLSISHQQKVLCEVNEVGQKVILARGGQGGGPSNGWIGLSGQKWTLELELRLIADVGLLGFPNAGKSTLLRALSKAKPKVASYPFTTIRPNIGIIEYPDLRRISVADLPGLIEGAHKNIGMGHRFLRHVERTKLLLMLVDIDGFSLSLRHKHRTCLENILLLNKELELYNPELLGKTCLLVINKLDTPGSDKKYEEIIHQIKHMQDFRDTVPSEMWPEQLMVFDEYIGISAKDKLNIDSLKTRMRHLMDEADLKEHRVKIELPEETGPRIHLA